MGGKPGGRRTWLFDLDNTLHDASASAFRDVNRGMTDYIVEHLGVDEAGADALRRDYWLRYGATLLGLVRHHGVAGAHFLAQTHRLPGLEERVYGHAQDFAALARLPGRRYILTNAPRDYTARVIGALGIGHLFDGVLCIEDMRMFGHWRPKPDRRMFRRLLARLHAPASVFTCAGVGDPCARMFFRSVSECRHVQHVRSPERTCRRRGHRGPAPCSHHRGRS